jgi:tetratricopeptide (TPR) repeat protein
MRFLTAPFLIAITSFAGLSQNPIQRSATSQEKQTAQTEAQLELDYVASSYKLGNFVEAQAHAERAVSLDPSNLRAALFLARVVHTRYKPGDTTLENIELARSAIAAYQRVLVLDSPNEEAYKAIAVLYAQIHEERLLREWLLQRASNPQFSKAQRAEAYAILAGKYWDCSFKITELPDNKVVEEKKKTWVVVYQKPKDPLEFERVKQCVASGLEMADLALVLNYNSETAWAYKTNLLLESAKLAGMEGMDLAKTKYEKEANQAAVQAGRLATERRQREESGEPTPEPATGRPSPPPPKPRF